MKINLKKAIYMKFLISFILLLTLASPGYCFLDFISDIVKWGSDQANQISNELFQKNMLIQTTEQLATLKKNYVDSKQFYDDFRRVQEDPNGVSQEMKRTFVSSLNNPVDRFFYEIDKKTYDKKSALQKMEDSGLEYVKTNWEFASKVKELIKDRDVKVKTVATKLASNQKTTVEEGQKELGLLQYEQFGSIERGILKLIELQNKQFEKQMWAEQYSINLQDQFSEFEKQLREEYKKEKPQSKENKIKKILNEEPKFQKP